MRKATRKDLQPIREKTARFGDAIVNNVQRGDLKDHGGHSTISIMWGLNSDSMRDNIFLLEINGEKAYLDVEELLSYTRLI